MLEGIGSSEGFSRFIHKFIHRNRGLSVGCNSPVDGSVEDGEICPMMSTVRDQDSADTPSRSQGSGPDLAAGIAVIEAQVRVLPNRPGVYRMLNANGDVLYVGKARNLRKRVASYTNPAKTSHRIARMVAETATLEVVTTHTDIQALLLESNLIKRLRPRYNVLMRDDKSFANILITGDHEWPQILKHRGARSKLGDYFGPFASAGAVNRTITALQRAFLIRNCSDSMFRNRTRPCLQYQIKRCAAPCVNYITHEDYAELIAQARSFLSGDSAAIQRALAEKMLEASESQEFEQAALYRDRIRALTQIQARQDINVQGLADADIFALHGVGGSSCIQVFFFRGGSNYGNRAYFPSHDRSHEADEILSAFIGQFYDTRQPPRLVLVSHEFPERGLLGEALSVRAGHRVIVARPTRGPKHKLVDHARINAREALARHFAESDSHRRLLAGVASVFDLPALPERIEIYDNSHIQGSHAVGAMIVAGPDGFVKNAYRKFNIRNTDGSNGADRPEDGDSFDSSDDYAMMRQVLRRRFTRAMKENDETRDSVWPDLVVIDGGQGQLSAAMTVVAELGIEHLRLVAISKGPDRNAGRERFHMPDRKPFMLPERDSVLQYLQRLRDEAHRFAIGTHRARRARALTQSGINDIPGIGAKRKRALLHHFGSARAVSAAGLKDLESVDGISGAIAKRIYDFFHDGS